MALFDSIVAETGDRFDLTGDQSKSLLSALFGLMTETANGGFDGFASRFRRADSGDAFSSWIQNGENAGISQSQIETAFGAETIAAVADRAGLDYATTVSAMTFLLPQTIDRLTPDGKMPDEIDVRAAINDFSRASNDSAVESATKTVSTGAFDRIGNATEDVGGKEHDMLSGNQISDFAPVGDRFSAAPPVISDDVKNENLDDEFNDESPLKWIVPLIITGLLVALGYAFCGGKAAEHASIFADSDLIKGFII